MSDPITVGKLIVDSKGLEKLVPLAASIGASVSDSLGKIDQTATMVEESLKQMTAEAQKDLALVRGQQQQTTAAVQADAKIRVATAQAESAERSSAAKMMSTQIIENEKQVTALVKEDATLRVQSQKQADAVILQDKKNNLQQALKAQDAFTKMQAADARQVLADANNTARQARDTQAQTAKKAIADSNNSTKVQLQNTSLLAKSAQQASKQTHNVQQLNTKQTMATQAQQAKMGVTVVQTASKMAIAASNNQTKLQIANINQVTNAQRNATRIQLANMRAAARQQAPATGGGIGGVAKGVLGGVAGVIGLGAIGGGAGAIASQVLQLAKNAAIATVESDKLAVAYERQLIGARNLAGGQAQLNQLLISYEEAAGGAVDKVTALQDVTKLLALGIATSTSEVAEFTKAARGISIAMGTSVQDVTEDIALATGNLSTRRLDQLGLSIQEVNERTEELRETNASWSREHAFGQAIIQIGIEKFGELTEAEQAQATGVEKMEKAWTNFGLTVGMIMKGPINDAAEVLEDILQKAQAAAEAIHNVQVQNQGKIVPGGVSVPASAANIPGLEKALAEAQERYAQAASDLAKGVGDSENLKDDMLTFEENIAAINVSLRAAHEQDLANRGVTFKLTNPEDFGQSPGVEGRTREQVDAIVDHEDALTDIANQAMNDRIRETNEWERQRTNVITQYEQQIAESAEDFGRRRARDNEEFARQIQEIEEDSAKKQLEAERDLADNIAKERRDHDRQMVKWSRDFNKSIADNNKDANKAIKEENKDFDDEQKEARADSAEKIKELDEDYAEDRAKALSAHNESLMEAAAHLDAWAVFNEQRKFARESEEAAKAHEKDIKEEKESLSKELLENQKSHDEKLADIRTNNAERNAEEQEAYDQRVKDANEALEQQIADQIAAGKKEKTERDAQDAERLDDMKTAHELRQTQEDTDRGIQLERDKTHHNAQLLEMDRVHRERITQIGQQEQKARDKLDDEFLKQMDELGLHQAEWGAAQFKHEKESLTAFDAFWEEIGKRFKDPTFGPQKKPEDVLDPVFNPYKSFLEDYISDLRADLKATKETDTDEIARLQGLIKRAQDALDIINGGAKATAEMVGGLGESVTDSPWTGLDTRMITDPINKLTEHISQQKPSVTMGDITIVLGDIGNRTDGDVKQLVGQAMIEWIDKAAMYQSTSRW